MHWLKLQTNLVVAVRASRYTELTKQERQYAQKNDSLGQRRRKLFLGLLCQKEINLSRCFFHVVTNDYFVCFLCSFIIEYIRSTTWFHCLWFLYPIYFTVFISKTRICVRIVVAYPAFYRLAIHSYLLSHNFCQFIVYLHSILLLDHPTVLRSIVPDTLPFL